jgi:polyribonucleotide nucleotidyltransferase
MREALGSAHGELSQFAPRMLSMKINPEKIRDVIGKGGATIRALTEETGTQIDISDDGTIVISSADLDRAREAQRRIADLTADVEVGQVYEGSVLRLLDFGAIVQVLPGRDGLLHISEIANQRIANINDVLKVGQQVRVKVIEADDKGRLRLSIKAIAPMAIPEAAPAAPAPAQE